ncbi:MAG: hypothetical protein HYV09_33375 [Deltaproteobacteria bacterium]|nr:hypothetical protein [Deltaproteobacteria bacterium]
MRRLLVLMAALSPLGCGDGDPPAPGAACIPTVGGFGAICNETVACPASAPICIARDHAAPYGYCTRECASVLDCYNEAGPAACSALAFDVPGVDGAVPVCALACERCPAGFQCEPSGDICLPGADAGPPEARPLCPSAE